MGESWCPNCRSRVVARFCGECGQKQGVELRTWSLFQEAAHELFQWDGAFLRSVRLLLLRPGQLTSEFFAGRRRSQTSPFKLFVFASAILFLAIQLVGLQVAATWIPGPSIEVGIAPPGFETWTIREQELFAARALDSMTGILGSASVLALPLLALALRGLLLRRPFTYAHHLVFVLHYGAASLFVLAVAMASGSVWVFQTAFGGLAIHLLLSLRRAYSLKLARTAVLTIALVVAAWLIYIALLAGTGFVMELGEHYDGSSGEMVTRS